LSLKKRYRKNLRFSGAIIGQNDSPQVCWINPFPNLPVETVDFVPGQNGNNGYLVAISLKPSASENQ